jgi:hypothetical protein
MKSKLEADVDILRNQVATLVAVVSELKQRIEDMELKDAKETTGHEWLPSASQIIERMEITGENWEATKELLVRERDFHTREGEDENRYK